jgi:hypothetical protein
MTDSLNVQIAKALGWTNLYDTEWIDDCQDLTKPLQDRLVKALCGTAPDGRHDCVVPDYLHSLDAVVAELPDRVRIEIQHEEVRFRAVVGAWLGYGATRKAAAAEALLKWALAQQKAGE